MKNAITYYRVSTERQGQSGLGLEAQKEAVSNFVKTHNYHLSGEFVEIESGRKNARPVLTAALIACKKKDATLLIAKLDRLGRNVAFISRLMESRVDFKAVDNPHASKLIVHIMAAFAEHERDQISERTAAALKVAKKNGVELGYNGKYVLSKENIHKAELFAILMQPVISEIRSGGIKTVRDIMNALNKRKIPTYGSGKKWYLNTVHRLLQRIKEIDNQKTQ